MTDKEYIRGFEDNRDDFAGYDKIVPVPPLYGLLYGIGSKTNSSEGIIVKTVKHPAAAILNEDNITEKILVDAIADIFNNTYKDEFWFKSQVNLWDLISKKGQLLDLLKEYENPLQPDIDLLYCHKKGYQLQSPLTGVEIKLFSKRVGQGKIIPKTTSWTGYYAGLDEAIALLNFGLDYVYLWQLFIFPSNDLHMLWEKYGKNFAIKITNLKTDYVDRCTSLIADTINSLELPIGYVPTFLAINNEESTFDFIQSFDFVKSPLFNINANSRETPYNFKNRVRDLLIQSFGIDEVKISLLEKECRKCSRLFSPKNTDFKYCPLCGSELKEYLDPELKE